MEHNSPGISEPSTRAHTIHDPSNSFVGTSSGHQFREECDYVAIRTALDDILCELRHHNDIDVEHNHLFRDMQR